MVFSKDEATNLNNDIVNSDNFESFKYKDKLLENTVAISTYGILRNITIFVLVKYLSNLGRSLAISLINCKVELKIASRNYCVLSALGADNVNANSNNIIFIIKDIKFYVPVVTLSAKDNQKLKSILSERSEKSLYSNEYKTKSENKNITNKC